MQPDPGIRGQTSSSPGSRLTATNAFHQYIFEQPLDESHTRLYFLNMRNWLLDDKHDQRVEQLTLNIVHEDMAVLENLNPVRTPETNNKEILLPGDGRYCVTGST